MPIHATCGSCGKGYTLGAELAGRRAKCKQCGAVFSIPVTAAATARPGAAAPRPAGVRPVPAAVGMSTAAASVAVRPAPAARPTRPAPAASDDSDGMPSLDSLGELEATGKPDAFSNMPPPMLEAEAGAGRSKRGATTIADADPVRAAEIAKEKARMTRRAILAGGGGLVGAGSIGFAFFVLRIVNRTRGTYNRNQRRRQQDEEADPEIETVADTPARRR